MLAHQEFSPISLGRDFVTGDVCDRFNALQQALKEADFKVLHDRLFVLGRLPVERAARQFLMEDLQCQMLEGAVPRLQLPYAFTVMTQDKGKSIGLVRGGVPKGMSWGAFRGALEAIEPDPAILRAALEDDLPESLVPGLSPVPGISQVLNARILNEGGILLREIAGKVFSLADLPLRVVTLDYGNQGQDCPVAQYSAAQPRPSQPS